MVLFSPRDYFNIDGSKCYFLSLRGVVWGCTWFSGSDLYFFCSIGVGRGSGSGIFYSGSGIFYSGSGFCCDLLGLLTSYFLELVDDVVQLVEVQWASASCVVSVMGSVLCSVWGSVSLVSFLAAVCAGSRCTGSTSVSIAGVRVWAVASVSAGFLVVFVFSPLWCVSPWWCSGSFAFVS